MTIKYCVNCENEIKDFTERGITDFCSNECANEYAASADPELVARAANQNPDALPNNDLLSMPRTKAGHLPPNTLEAVQAILQTSGVTSEDMQKAINDSERK